MEIIKMPRKTKDVYSRIEEVQNKIVKLQEEIKELEVQLVALNKEKDSLEMKKIFDYAKDNNLGIDEVINAINLFSIQNTPKK